MYTVYESCFDIIDSIILIVELALLIVVKLVASLCYTVTRTLYSYGGVLQL